MTDAGIPRIPEPGQYRPDAQARGSEKDTTIGRVEKAPLELRAELTARRKAIRLEGEVIRTNKDGSVRVRTERGDIDVRLSGNERQQQAPLKAGDRVDVEISPPPRNAPEQPAQVTIRPIQTPTVEITPPIRTSTTPVEIEVRDGQTAQPTRIETQITRPAPVDPNAPPPPNRFPEAGSIVRLEPVSPEQLNQLIENNALVSVETIKQSLQAVLPPQQTLPTAEISPAVQSITTDIPQNITADIVQTPQTAEAANGATETINTQLTPLQLSNTSPPSSGDFPQPENAVQLKILSTAQALVAHAKLLNAPHAAAPTVQDARAGFIQPSPVQLTAPVKSESTSSPLSSFITPLPKGGFDLQMGTHHAGQVSGVVIAKTTGQIPLVSITTPRSIGIAARGSLAASILPPNPISQQIFALQFPSDALLIGSRIDILPQSISGSLSNQASITESITSSLVSAPVLTPYANTGLPLSWPVINDIEQSIIQSSIQTAAQTAQSFSAILPNPAKAAQFAPAALFFMAAVRGGDLGSWLGDRASDILHNAGKTSLISRLGDESTSSARAAPEGSSQEWRGVNIPLLWDGDTHKIALHYRLDQRDDKDPQHSGNKGTRFVFDLMLDAMGSVQVDGFFRPVSENGPRLDVVLRTEERFSGTMQAEMRRLYMDAIKPSQVGGELSFQSGFDNWVMIEAEKDKTVGVSA